MTTSDSFFDRIDPIEWKLSQNRFQIYGAARRLARQRLSLAETDPVKTTREELALVACRAYFLSGSRGRIPSTPERRELSAEEREFVDAFLGPESEQRGER